MAYACAIKCSVNDDVTWPQRCWGSTIGYPSYNLASCDDICQKYSQDSRVEFACLMFRVAVLDTTHKWRCNSLSYVNLAALPLFRPGNPALCGSQPLVALYYCRLGDLLCFVCVHVCLLFVWFVCVLFVLSVLWYCWLVVSFDL